MDKKSILEGYANGMEISSALRELGKAYSDSLLKLPPEPVTKQVHWHNVTIKAIKTELKPMSIDEVKKAPELIQKLYFCYLSNTAVGTDLLIEANEKYPTYFK